MKLDTNQYQELADVALRAAKEAGAMIRSHAGKDIKYDKKETGTSLASQVVTEVDRMSQEIVLKIIEPTLEKYDIGLLAEESEDDGSRFEKDYFWSIDPMDGTLPFIESRCGYAVSIGFVAQDGSPVIGVVYDAWNDIVYHGIKGVGAFRNEEPWKPDLSVVDGYKELDLGGAVMNSCWVLEQGPAYWCKFPKKQNGGGCVWDYAATAAIYEALGAWVSDIYGDPLKLNRKELPYMNHKGVLFATNESIARQIIRKK